MQATTDSILKGEPIRWQHREWVPVTVAVTPDEMARYLRNTHFRYDSGSAAEMSHGGTFDVTFWPSPKGKGTFVSYTVASAHAGLVRLYRATDTRTLRNGQAWR